MRIAVVGLGFGADFVPIYQQHPDVEQVAVCDQDEARLQQVGDRFGVADRFTRLEDILADERYDAVHLLTPVPYHVEQTLAVLAAGKHCACAVPMATSLDDLWRILAAQQASGKNYVMMETCVYTREFLFVQDLYRRGEMGTLTFLRGTYYQDLEGDYPTYWRAQPPMHYGTHAIAPLLALAQTRAELVHCGGNNTMVCRQALNLFCGRKLYGYLRQAVLVCCLGSGRLRPDIQQPDGNIFPLQTGIFRLAGTDVVAEVTRSWFQVAHPYTETFSAYGDRRGFEWQLEHEQPLLFTLEPVEPARRGRPVTTTRVQVPDRADLLPEAIARFTQGGHGGSHPHLVHEFVRSIVEQRTPAIDARRSADWTAPGICAHESALRGGEPVAIPDFSAV